ncbi:hypothetical protein B0H10DRAFT_1843442 [Mycena sp. CBHHK59/15]|nr:hypothetical protein B0H10DRAFT_1843442 [Mycena sp. CBHHK59/15]
MATKTVKRKQFPLTAAYSFTDYRSQGQTLPYVFVDIATPPSGALSLFNLYIALSRSSAELLAEDDRLEGLNEKMLKWWDRMKTRTAQ